MHVVVPGEVLSARVSLGLPDLTKRKKLALWIRFDTSCIMLYSRNLKKWCRSRVHDYVRSESDPSANLLLLHPHHPSDPMASSEIPVGNSIPAFTEHAISVSLPKLADNVAYEEGEARILDAMVSGYPRFFIQRNIRKVSGRFFLLPSGAPHTTPPHAHSFPRNWNKNSAHAPKAPFSSPPANPPKHAAHSSPHETSSRASYNTASPTASASSSFYSHRTNPASPSNSGSILVWESRVGSQSDVSQRSHRPRLRPHRPLPANPPQTGIMRRLSLYLHDTSRWRPRSAQTSLCISNSDTDGIWTSRRRNWPRARCVGVLRACWCAMRVMRLSLCRACVVLQ